MTYLKETNQVKKKLTTLFAVALISVFGLVACQQTEQQATETAYTDTIATDTALVQTETTATTTFYQDTDTSVQTETFGGTTDEPLVDGNPDAGTTGTTNTY
jgi:tellurite resistance protein